MTITPMPPPPHEPDEAPAETSRRLLGARISVLGGARVDGASLTPRQAAIVAALALHHDRPVPATTLIDLVWPEGPPATARASLQNQVTRLRARFGPRLIGTSPAGYRLGPQTDAAQFEAEATALLARAPDAAVAGRLATLLGGWRSTPYADLVDVTAAEVEQARLLELRCRVEEHLASSWVVIGQLDQAVTTLESLVAAEPYRERRWELLVTALAAAGRGAEARRAYQRCEDRLRSDLGVDPSPTMQALAASLDEPVERRVGPTDHVVASRRRCGPLSSRRQRASTPSYWPR